MFMKRPPLLVLIYLHLPNHQSNLLPPHAFSIYENAEIHEFKRIILSKRKIQSLARIRVFLFTTCSKRFQCFRYFINTDCTFCFTITFENMFLGIFQRFYEQKSLKVQEKYTMYRKFFQGIIIF